MDRTILDLRQALEASGMWDESTILLTADHPLRVDATYGWGEKISEDLNLKQSSEVPYLLKMPGAKQRIAYDKPAEEVLTKRLLLSILKREVITTGQVAEWLDRNSALGPSLKGR